MPVRPKKLESTPLRKPGVNPKFRDRKGYVFVKFVPITKIYKNDNKTKN